MLYELIALEDRLGIEVNFRIDTNSKKPVVWWFSLVAGDKEIMTAMSLGQFHYALKAFNNTLDIHSRAG